MRVRLALHEKGVAFATREEDLANFSQTLRALHPEAKVPVLVQGKLVLYESAIIIEYIEDAFPIPPPLMPKAAAARAEIRLLGYWCNQFFKLDIDRFKYGVSRFTSEECDGVEIRLQGHLGKLEARLSSSAWLVESEYSLADILVFPFARQLVRTKPRAAFLDEFPKFLEWIERISERPAFKKTIEK